MYTCIHDLCVYVMRQCVHVYIYTWCMYTYIHDVGVYVRVYFKVTGRCAIGTLQKIMIVRDSVCCQIHILDACIYSCVYIGHGNKNQLRLCQRSRL